MEQMKEERQNLTMAEPNRKLHVAMFPWLAFGHIIPYLELAKLIAQKGHKISFISTPKNIHRLPTHTIPSNLRSQINFVSLSLPPVEHLPDNAEATSDLPYDKIPYLKIAYDGLHGPLLHFLKASAPDWIIYDFSAHWLPPITADLGISSAFFSILAAWSISFFGSSSAMINGVDPRTKPEDFTVPPEWVSFPSKVAYRLHEAKRIFDNLEVNNSGVSDAFRVGSVIAGVDVIALRSCNELESDFLRLVSQLHGKPAFPLGLLPPSAVEGNSTDEDNTWVRIREWLDEKNKASVVYIAFGSELELSQDVINELALGLELSSLPFFWTLRKPKGSSVELPDGFEERMKDRGLVWTSWAPQLKILGHESVGGFMTHCGLSSVVEALQFELPLILLPFTLDQGLNARIFAEKKMGIEVERDETDGSFTKESVANSVRLIMVEKEGLVYREDAKEMKKLFADKDLHNRYIDEFVFFLENHRVATNFISPSK